jgi:HK97 family phage prohead protease
MKLHTKIVELQNKNKSPFWTYDSTIDTRKLSTNTDDNVVKAYYCLWNQKDSHGTQFLRGAFKRSIEERGPNSSAKYKITVLYMHDQRDPIGLPSVLEERDDGLYAEFSPDDVPSGERVIKQIRSGTIQNFSFGFKPIWEQMKYNESTDTIEISEVELLEISPVTIGSNRNTYSIRGDNDKDEFIIEDTEDFIRSIPRKQQLELRQLIDRHRLDALTPQQPLTTKAGSIDYKFLIDKLKLKK